MPTKRTGPRGFSEETVVAKTGRSTEEWNTLLDAWGAALKGHTQTAKYLRDGLGVSPWWAQAVTNRYEHARGLRND